MPPHTRSSRRRQNTQRTTSLDPRIETATEAVVQPRVYDAPEAEEAPVGYTVPTMSLPTTVAALAEAARTGTRRTRRSAVPEPVDYTKDYASARQDLRWISLWAVILFAAMIALRLSGIV